VKRLLPTLAVLALAAPVPAHASDELAKKHGCLACHSIDKKLIGPSYKEIAAKYRNDTNAEAKLADKVKKGGAGNWGQVPMAPNPTVPDAELKALVKWVLRQK